MYYSLSEKIPPEVFNLRRLIFLCFLYGQIRPFYGIFRHFAIQKTPFFECFLPKNGAFFKINGHILRELK